MRGKSYCRAGSCPGLASPWKDCLRPRNLAGHPQFWAACTLSMPISGAAKLAQGSVQHAIYVLWIASDEREIRPRRLIRFRTALLPVAQRPNRNMISLGEFLLRQVQRPANDLHSRRLLHALEIGPSQWLRVGIRPRGLFDLFRSGLLNHLVNDYNTSVPSAIAARCRSSSAVARIRARYPMVHVR
jgi:hypothetical protein